MKQIILDLRGLIKDGDSSNLSDDPAHNKMENLLLDYAGKIIKIRITTVRAGKLKSLSYIMTNLSKGKGRSR